MPILSRFTNRFSRRGVRIPQLKLYERKCTVLESAVCQASKQIGHIHVAVRTVEDTVRVIVLK